MGKQTEPAGERPHAFHLLDGLRGVAALAVVQLHMKALFGRNVFPHGYLAVDFFFMISGFVLHLAYQPRLDAGWSTASFFKTRLVRLYPLYFAGMLIAFLYRLLQYPLASQHIGALNLTLQLGLALMVLPAPAGFHAIAIAAFPLNAPTWSLFSELCANFYHAFFLRRRKASFLLGAIAVAGLVLLASGARLGTMDFGWKRSQTLYAFPRVIFSYTAGLLLFRVWKSGKVRFRLAPVWCTLLLVGTLAAPIATRFLLVYEMAVVTIVFPVLLLLSAAAPVTGRAAQWVCGVLGTGSYALYVLHVPIGEVFVRLWIRLRHYPVQHDAPWAGVVYLAVLLPLVFWADTWYDRPARSFLRARLERVGPRLRRTWAGQLLRP